ncbi:hypothetical protein DER46DRAFT_631196 [Fusarium sp. MPI-SDFR-AT-0072]|nr:hypothetical protein DER46DRAFT_631196 [Fusarium sp. MPI-SDFR-AT-0072]
MIPPSCIISASLFFKEAIDASLVPIEVGVGSTYNALPTQPAEFKNLGGSKTLQNILPSVIGDKKLNRRAHTRRQSRANEVLLESSAYGQAAESPNLSKRSQKPKKQLKEQKVAVLEYNCIAANKCRLGKRDKALALASREETMED